MSAVGDVVDTPPGYPSKVKVGDVVASPPGLKVGDVVDTPPGYKQERTYASHPFDESAFSPRFRGEFGKAAGARAIYGALQGYGLAPGDVTSVMSGPHVPGSAHFDGRAIDVGAVGGQAVGYNPHTLAFLRQAIAHGNLQRIGSTKQIVSDPSIRALAAQYGVDLFEDEGTGPHLHLQVGPAIAGLTPGHDTREADFRNRRPPEVPKGAVRTAGIGEVPKGVSSFFKAAGRTVHEGLVDFDWARHQAQRDPMGAFTALVGTLQRPTAAALGDVLRGHGQDALHDAWQAVRTPEDATKINDALIRAVITKSKELGVPFADVSDAAEKTPLGHIVAQTLTETVSDPLTYVPVADLFTIGGRAVRVGGHLLANASGARALLGAMGNNPAARSMIADLSRGLKPTMDTLTNIRDVVGHTVKTVRPELDTIFDADGKAMRLSVEAAAQTGMTEQLARDSKLFKQAASKMHGLTLAQPLVPELRNRFLEEAWRYGDAAARRSATRNFGFRPSPEDIKNFPQPLGYLRFKANTLQPVYDIPSKALTGAIDTDLKRAQQFFKQNPDAFTMAGHGGHLHGFTQEEVAKHRLVLSRWAVRREQIAAKTEEFISQHGGLKTAPATKTTLRDWLLQNVPDRDRRLDWTVKIPGKGKEVSITDMTNAVSNTFKQGIMWNPFPHGLWNVGVIAGMRGGPTTAANGLRYAMTDIPQHLVERMKANGAWTSYWRDDPQGAIALLARSGVPVLRDMAHAVNSEVQLASHVLDRLENGYRAAYMEMVEAQYRRAAKLASNAPLSMKDELLIGRRVAHEMGDYANTTLLVKFLNAVGGMFVNFRFGIVPQAVAHSVTKQGLLGASHQLPVAPLLARANQHFNETTASDPNAPFEQGGPVGDTARLYFDPFGYVTSQASIGPVGNLIAREIARRGANWRPFDWEQYVASQAQSIIPGYDALQYIPGWEGTNPYGDQHMPAWMRGFTFLAGGYKRQLPADRTERKERREYERMRNR